MSEQGMLATVLATQLSLAMDKDIREGSGGCDISAGMYGEATSAWVREIAAQLAERDATIAALRAWDHQSEERKQAWRAAASAQEQKK